MKHNQKKFEILMALAEGGHIQLRYSYEDIPDKDSVEEFEGFRVLGKTSDKVIELKEYRFQRIMMLRPDFRIRRKYSTTYLVFDPSFGEFAMISSGELINVDILDGVRSSKKCRVVKGDLVTYEKCTSLEGDTVLFGTNYNLAPSAKLARVHQVYDSYAMCIVGGAFRKFNLYDIGKVEGLSKDVNDLIALCAEKNNNVVVGDEVLHMHHVKMYDDTFEFIEDARLDRFEGDFWNEELRSKYATKTKIRRGILKLIPDLEVTTLEYAVDSFVKTFNAEVLTGEAIFEVYNNYVDQGSLGASCMRNKKDEWFELYARYAKCLVMRNPQGKVEARAFLWDIVHDETGEVVTVLDRMYVAKTPQEARLKGWAKAQGYYRIESNTYSQKAAVNDETKAEIDLSKYHVKAPKIDEVTTTPYVDTFYIVQGDTLRVAPMTKMYSLQNTNGKRHNV